MRNGEEDDTSVIRSSANSFNQLAQSLVEEWVKASTDTTDVHGQLISSDVTRKTEVTFVKSLRSETVMKKEEKENKEENKM
jgi:hypothetical protein